MSENNDLVKQLKECEKLKNEYLAGWQRARADFLNYKKEEERRLGDFSDYINRNFVFELLPVLDSFQRAQEEVKKKGNKLDEGFLKIEEQLLNILKRQGLEEIQCKVGDSFDPNFQETIEAVEDKRKAGQIVEIVQKGYKFKDKILRPVKVKVAK